MKINLPDQGNIIEWLPDAYEEPPQLAAIRNGSFEAQAGRTACPSAPSLVSISKQDLLVAGALNVSSLGPKPGSGRGRGLLEFSVLPLLPRILGSVLPRCLC